jgi:hypothetical protein
MCQIVEKIAGFYTGYKDAGVYPIRLTDDNFDCDFVTLSVVISEDNTFDTPLEIGRTAVFGAGAKAAEYDQIYWGFGNLCGHQISPGETSDLIPVNSARDIFVRSSQLKNSLTRVYFSLFKFVEKE